TASSDDPLTPEAACNTGATAGGRRSLQGLQELPDAPHVEDAPDLGPVQAVDDRIGFVAVAVHEGPGDLLLAPPGHAYGPAARVARDVGVMAAPGSTAGARALHHVPGGPGLHLGLGRLRQVEAEAHADVQQDRLTDRGMILGMDLGE